MVTHRPLFAWHCNKCSFRFTCDVGGREAEVRCPLNGSKLNGRSRSHLLKEEEWLAWKDLRGLSWSFEERADARKRAALLAALQSLPPSVDHPTLDYTPRDLGPGWQSKESCNVARDLFGHLFYRPMIEPMWLTWNGATISKLAQAIAEQEAFDRLPILADALEEAGCASVAILDHCREPARHYRGCWVIDCLLGRA